LKQKQNRSPEAEKSDVASVAAYRDREVITPRNKLRKAINPLPTPPGDDPLARAEQALSQLSVEFSDWMHTECDRLDAARDRVRDAGLTKEHLAELFHAAHDIKGESATFGYPLVGAAAESLCQLIEHTPDAGQIPSSMIDQHVDAVRAIVREYKRPDVDSVAGTLVRCLREVTEEFLVQANKDRPEYLAEIAAPSIAPSDRDS